MSQRKALIHAVEDGCDVYSLASRVERDGLAVVALARRIKGNVQVINQRTELAIGEIAKTA